MLLHSTLSYTTKASVLVSHLARFDLLSCQLRFKGLNRKQTRYKQ